MLEFPKSGLHSISYIVTLHLYHSTMISSWLQQADSIRLVYNTDNRPIRKYSNDSWLHHKYERLATPCNTIHHVTNRPRSTLLLKIDPWLVNGLTTLRYRTLELAFEELVYKSCFLPFSSCWHRCTEFLLFFSSVGYSVPFLTLFSLFSSCRC